MRLVVLILLSSVMASSILLALPAAAERWCVEEVAGDYLCTAESKTTVPDFPAWCAERPGGIISTSPTDPRCVQVCCCIAGEEAAYEATPISAQRCQSYEDRNEEPAQPDCDAACGGSAGGGGSAEVVTVSGHVYDVGDGTPAGLDSARVEYPLGNRLITFYTEDDGSFSLRNVALGTVTFKATKQGCGEQQVQRKLTAAITDLDFELNCATGGCTVNPVADTAATPVPGEAKVRIGWTPGSCDEGAIVYRCEGDAAACKPDTSRDTPIGYAERGVAEVTDAHAEPGKAYCYKVHTINSTGGLVNQSVGQSYTAHCILPMHAACTAGSVEPTCYNADETLRPVNPSPPPDIMSPFTGSAHCGPDNRVQVDEVCAGGTFCHYDSAGQPRCRAPGDCEKCNGIFGFFVDAAASIGGQSCASLAGCYLDNRGYVTDTFESCSEIRSCEDYRSEEACTKTVAGKDSCRVVEGGCRWVDGLAELGKGACIPKTAEPQCGRCSELFGACDAALCSSLGPCYYNAEKNSEDDLEAGECIPKSAMACAYYDTQQDCSGGRDVAVAATYDKQDLTGKRTAGTHAVTASQDKLGLGKCAWLAAEGYCVKNANGWLPPLPGLDDRRADDCYERTRPVATPACLRDIVAPETSLTFNDGEYIDAARLRASAPIVTDAAFTAAQIRTYACLVPASSAPCYPVSPFDNLVPTQIGVGSYKVYYYSEDPAGNLAEIETITLNIEQDSNAHLVNASLIR